MDKAAVKERVEPSLSAERRIVQRNVLFRSLLIRSEAFFLQLLKDNIASFGDELLEPSVIIEAAKQHGADAVCKYNEDEPETVFTVRDLADSPEAVAWVDLFRDIHQALKRSP